MERVIELEDKEHGISKLPQQSNPDVEEWVSDAEPEDLCDVAEMWQRQGLGVREPRNSLEGALLDELEIIHYMIENRIQELEDNIQAWREQQSYSGMSKSQNDLTDKIDKARSRIDELQRMLVYADNGDGE